MPDILVVMARRAAVGALLVALFLLTSYWDAEADQSSGQQVQVTR